MNDTSHQGTSGVLVRVKVYRYSRANEHDPHDVVGLKHACCRYIVINEVERVTQERKRRLVIDLSIKHD